MSTDRDLQDNLASIGGVEGWQALNYLYNITPQKSDLNQRARARLEDKEQDLSKRRGIDSVYVLTGTLCERYIGTLPSATKQHSIPSGYWKIIFTNSTPTQGTFAAFIMNQAPSPGQLLHLPGHSR
ncbi:DNA/RNA non-specific endonuclease [Pseudomonas fuscovaginae UPB0736]|uniref:DNA/RNA non-specific endonuclease n=1 Tax=Pseudomonas asplenii TaxID=53407 RepID=UPI000302B290|nr:DNA/RNA non-specific endonuclease [Pseudomonas fuscovaginae]UUQ64408.1 DNA/RNA non-specific endonuclease [Pseudomonas fuscovaginae UPB0736]